jgi:hypothetical protein
MIWFYGIQPNDTLHNGYIATHSMQVLLFYSYAECHFVEGCSAECHYAKCHYAKCHSAKCHYAKCHYASGIRHNVIMPSVILPGVIMPSVIMQNVVSLRPPHSAWYVLKVLSLPCHVRLVKFLLATNGLAYLCWSISINEKSFIILTTEGFSTTSPFSIVTLRTRDDLIKTF